MWVPLSFAILNSVVLLLRNFLRCDAITRYSPWPEWRNESTTFPAKSEWITMISTQLSSFANSQCDSNSALGARPCDTFGDMNN